jgi:hypothetical protein
MKVGKATKLQKNVDFTYKCNVSKDLAAQSRYIDDSNIEEGGGIGLATSDIFGRWLGPCRIEVSGER